MDLKTWGWIRDRLNEIKEETKDSEDLDIQNLRIVLDNLILSTYMPDQIEHLYRMVDEHMNNTLGGQN